MLLLSLFHINETLRELQTLEIYAVVRRRRRPKQCIGLLLKQGIVRLSGHLQMSGLIKVGVLVATLACIVDNRNERGLLDEAAVHGCRVSKALLHQLLLPPFLRDLLGAPLQRWSKFLLHQPILLLTHRLSLQGLLSVHHRVYGGSVHYEVFGRDLSFLFAIPRYLGFADLFQVVNVGLLH